MRTENTKIAFITAGWHSEIVDTCKNACIEELRAKKCKASVETFSVPGSLEIPLTAELLAETGQYEVILAAGFIVDGGIYRHDFVANAVIQGIVQVALKTKVPVLSAILTPHHFHEHTIHQKFFEEHMNTKGKELALACIKTLKNLEAIRKIPKIS